MPQLGFLADTFQPDFYVTCATVIPVLFLALVVQERGQVFESVLRTSRQADTYAARSRLRRKRRSESAPERPKRWHRTREELAGMAALALDVYAVFLVFTGTVGEGFALYVLYRESPLGAVRGFLFVATTLLAVTVAAGPFLAFVGPKGARAADQKAQDGHAAPIEDQHRGPGTGAGGPPSDGTA